MEKMNGLKKPLILGLVLTILLALLPVPVVAADEGNNSSSYTYVSSSLYPSPVKFRLQTLVGTPVSNVTINATAISSTAGDTFIDGVLDLLGLGSSGEDISLDLNSMEGETATDGSIVLFMFSSYKYHITFSHPDYSVDPIDIYPNSAEYFILVTPKSKPNIAVDIKFNLSVSEISDTEYDLKLYYNDTSLTTTSVKFFVKADRYNSEGETFLKTLHESTYSSNSVDTSYTITDEPGENASLPYYWGFSAKSTAFDNPINQTKTIRFKHILVGDGVGAFWLQCLSIGLLTLIAAIGSIYNVKEVLLTLGLFAGLFKFLQWFQITGNEYLDWSIVSLVLVFGIMYYIRKKEQEERL
jgi:hypothetical protein